MTSASEGTAQLRVEPRPSEEPALHPVRWNPGERTFVLDHRDLRAAERLAQAAAWSWDVARGVFMCSPELFPVIGITPPEFESQGDVWLELTMAEWLASVPEQERSRLRAQAIELLRTRTGTRMQYRIRRGPTTRWLEVFAGVAEEHDGRVTRVAGIAQDVTERVRAERRRDRAARDLVDQHRVLELIARDEPVQNVLDHLCLLVERRFPGATCTVLRVDREGGVLRDLAGPSVTASYRDAVDGLPIGEGSGACGTAAARGEPVIVDDMRADPLTSRYAEVIAAAGFESVWSHPLVRGTGEVMGTFAVYRESPGSPSERERRFVRKIAVLATLALERASIGSRLEDQARHDSLTGLLNRARFLELTNEALRGAELPLAVMFLELDRFKQVSDRLGHVASDRVLVFVAERLEEAVGADGIVGRFGTDEFAVMVPDAASARNVAEAVLSAFSAPFKLDGGELFLIPTVGIVRSDSGTDAYGLVRDAAAAMHEARAEGVGQIHVYDRSIRARVIARVNRGAELRRAIEGDQLVMHYQPIFRLSDGVAHHVEALVRWNHPQHGMIQPGEFIALAEETGLMLPLGQRVLQMVVAQAKEWAQRLPDVRLSANVSPSQVASPRFVDSLAQLLTAEEVAPQQLILEITESGLIGELETAHPVISDLRELGVSVVVDDFGIGYSSLARLYELPISGLKIDRSFVRRISADPTAQTVVAAVTEIARSHRCTVVAEGVEDADALAAVERAGCDYAQGYHLGRPAPVEAAEALITESLRGLGVR